MVSSRVLAFRLAALAAGMVMLSYASVPLYRLFCATTGFGGTTQRTTTAAPEQVLKETITVRFNADVSPELPWKFAPETREVRMPIGKHTLVAYQATNTASVPTTGHATFNVVPEVAGAYFNKIECFCFKDQTLASGQTVHMPVSFFIDPAITTDPATRDVRTITLSYTFFPKTP